MARIENIGEKANCYNPEIAATFDHAVEQKLQKHATSTDKQSTKHPYSHPCLHL